MIHQHAGLATKTLFRARVETILCGGKLSPEQMREWIP